MIQGSPEWFAARCGRCTASRFADVLATIRSGGEAAGRRNYKAELVCERLTGIPVATFESAEMRFGREQEPYARIAYEARTGLTVLQCGFLEHADILAGASPDGLIGFEGGLEIKCPHTATHIDTLLRGMAPEHMAQIQGGMWISARQWWDFVSYDSRMPERFQLYIRRVQRDQKYIDALEVQVRKFLNEVETMLHELEALPAERIFGHTIALLEEHTA
jgi:YqaJ-like viral recombinase domain